MKAVIVIPAYNESEAISEVVECARQYLDVIVVDDHSTDNTSELALASGATVVNAKSKVGYVGGIALGFHEAVRRGYSHVITIDGDGQHPILKIPRFIELLQNNDFVGGRRDSISRISERLLAWYYGRRYGFTDPLCGMKGYSVELFNRYGAFDRHNLIGAELALYAIKNRYKWTMLDIEIRGRVGESKFGSDLKANWLILKAFIRSINILKDL